MKNKLLQKNNLAIISFLLLMSNILYAQNIADYYVNIPDILNPTLSRQNRLELLEYHKVGQDSITNRFGNQARLVSLDSLNRRIVVKNTPTSIFEMKILNLEDKTPIIGIIRTVCSPVCLSSIEFYDTAWNQIPIQFLMPKAIEWADIKSIPDQKVDVNWVKNMMDVSFITLNFSSENQFIIAKNNTLDFLSEADRKIIAPYINSKTITYKLQGRTWVQLP
ncbi:MAG: DUF3256 family protein [Paludibacter sp.]|nr:DUF3256 family protein [Paludibacter sp.]